MTDKYSSPSVSIVMPSFMEAGRILTSLRYLRKILQNQNFEFEIIVVVDGDYDQTASILKTLDWPELLILINDSNRGKGYSLRRGVKEARATDFIGLIDADGDINPSALLVGIKTLQESDVLDFALGSKLHPKSSINYPRLRHIQSRLYAKLVAYLFRLPTLDTQTGLKIGKANAMKRSFENTKLNGFSLDVEMLVMARINGFSFVDIPVSIEFESLTTVGFKQSLSALRDLVFLKMYLRKRMN